MTNSEACLDTLPEELILTIIDHLNDLDSLQSLSNLNRTSHRLHRLTSERLYHRFLGRNSELALRTLSQTPGLARYVKEAVWHQERRTRPHIDVIEKTHIIQKLNQLTVPHGTDLAEQFAKLGHHDDYWYMEVLLLFMPNLESLTICHSWLWDDHHYWFKSLSPFFNPLSNSKLTIATLYGPLRIENIIPLLTITSLTTLSLTQVVVMRREGYRVFQWSVWPVERLLANGSNLSHLTLRESYIELEDLIPIFRNIKALKSFTYEHVPNDLVDERAMVYQINSSAFMRCWKLQSESLEYLRIRDTRSRDCSLMARLIREDSDDALFSGLCTLDVGPLEPIWYQASTLQEAVNVLVEALPPSLKTLRFMIDHANDWEHREQGSDWKHSLDEFLRVLASTIVSARPTLGVVELVDWPPVMGYFPDSLPMLQKLYRDLNLRLGSVCGDVLDFFETDPLLVEEDAEEDWIMVTDLKFISTL